MIKLESVHIEEVRGIRKLDIDFLKGSFVIYGPNGSGKSGVIDAIEFGLTGQIGRLTGRGTKGLSVAEHGPHVDKTSFPDAAFVQLRVFLPAINKSVIITRKVSAPTKPKIMPADDEVKTALAEIADHPEIMLSRREILRFILVEPAKRSEEIQTLLKLEELGHTRAALNSAQNKLQGQHRTATALVETSRNALLLHLKIATLRSEDLLNSVNSRRKLLGLSEIADLTPDTRVDAGLSGSTIRTDFNKQSALRDLNALAAAADEFPTLAKAEVEGILTGLDRLEKDPALLAAVQRRAFIEKGLELIDGPTCPLCDLPWEDEQHIREHLIVKLAKSAQAQEIQEGLLKKATAVAQAAIRVAGVINPAKKIAEVEGEEAIAQMLTAWRTDLEQLKAGLTTVDGLRGLKERFVKGWLGTPNNYSKFLSILIDKVTAKPDQSAALDAQTFLTTAQMRLGDYRESLHKNEASRIAFATSKEAYEAYCLVLEEELNSLYDEVEKDFSTYYRAINEDDESTFTAKLTPSEGKLDLKVNFYERGLFPPGAYHSEGHQDSMGVCLYLALMKRLFSERFTFALLDDVVMSIDTGHRYQFCKLLKIHFPDTQFIITTHDRVWAEQMKSAGLVTAKKCLAFHSWTIDTGPLVESTGEIWLEIAASLGKGNVQGASSALRHHLEYISRLLADQLSAPIPFRADGNYELGDLLPNMVGRMKELYGKAADAAQSWGNVAAKDSATKCKAALSQANIAANVEQWAVNKAVHYNEWANFGKKDFEPVVDAFKNLLRCFRCEGCDSWLYVTPRTNPESLRCSCGEINLNLRPKPK